MAVSQKISETGWFYHAPPKRISGQDAVLAPPTSQIPGLSDLPPEPAPQESILIKEFDSPYIRMAKMGGRSDLLRMHTPKERSKEAQPYPKVDWFYTEDIKLENDENKPTTPTEPHQFLLPDYMVHQSRRDGQPHKYVATGRHANIPPQKPPPFAMESNLPFQNQGHVVKRGRKNNRNDEKKVGFGIQRETGEITDNSPSKYVQIAREVPVKPKSELNQNNRTPPGGQDNNNADMSKLMTHGYGQDWMEHRDKWSSKKNTTNDVLPLSAKKSSLRTQKVESYVPSESNARTRHNCYKEEEKKELFKMSKFKNIPSKLDCHRTATNGVDDVDKELQQLGVDPNHE